MTSQLTLITSLVQVGGSLFTGSSVLHAWALYFSELALPSSHPSFDDGYRASVESEFASLVSLAYSAPPAEFCLDKVSRAVSSVPRDKSSGPDGAQAEPGPALRWSYFAFMVDYHF